LFAGMTLAAFLAVTAPAQTVATFVGTVKDSSGAVVPGASVTARHVATNEQRQTVTTDQGDYRITLLRVGRYELRVELPGFRAAVVSNLEVQLGQTARIDVELKVGQVADSITVTGAAPLVRSETVSLGEVMDNRKILELPLNNRDFLQLATLTPGVTRGRARTTGSVEISGGRRGHNNFRMDGIDNTDHQYNGLTATPPIDAIEEFQVVRNLYDVEFGRASGGVVDVKLRSGTNAYHGSLYEFHRNSALDARNFFSLVKAPLRFHQYGAAAGGPIRKERTFFFFNYEGFREARGTTTVLNVPSALERNGDFSATAQKPVNPFTGTAFTGHQIPQNLWNPVGRKLVDLLPAANTADTVRNYVVNPLQTRHWDTYMTRVDQKISDRQSLSFSMVLGVRDALNPSINKYAAIVNKDNGYAYAVNHNFAISPRLVNELRLGYNRKNDGQDAADKTDYTKELGYGLPEGAGFTGAPRLNLSTPVSSSFDYFGTGGGGKPLFRTNNNYNIVNILTLSRGAHNLRFGFDGKRNHNNWVFYAGNFHFFRGNYATNTWAELLMGMPGQTVFQPDAGWGYHRRSLIGLYVQDDWKVSPRLTVNIGLRWDINTPYKVKDKRMATFDVTKGQMIYPKGAPLGNTSRLLYPWREEGPATAFDTNWGDIGPRLGVAFRPTARNDFVVRAGYGIFYSPAEGFVTTYTTFVSPWQARITTDGWCQLCRVKPPAGQPDRFLYLDNPRAYFDPNGPLREHGTTFVPASRRFRDASLQQWNVSVEKELLRATSFELSYVGTKAVHLSGSGYGHGFAKTFLGLDRYPGFPDVRLRTDGFNSEYNAFQFKVNRRFSRGLSFLSSYTWSKGLGDVSNNDNYLLDLGGGGEISLRELWGRTDMDVRHIYNFSGIYEIPIGRGRHLSDMHWLANGILGGWKLNYILQANSGYGFDLFAQTGPTGALRPNLKAGRSPNLPSSDRTLDRWFDPTAFELPPSGKKGNLGKNLIEGPGFAQLDLGISKTFDMPFRERHSLEFRSEFFNILNHANFTFAERNLIPGAERITGAYDGRSIQFALKYLF
jgi:hypothetical protein